MSKKTLTGVLTAVLVLGTASMALAGDEAVKAAGMWVFFGIAIACAGDLEFVHIGDHRASNYHCNRRNQ